MIKFHSDYAGFELENRPGYKNWLESVILHEGLSLGEITYIFCTDSSLLEINEEFLDHHDYTDIITFPLSEVANIIRGEIYISIDRVKENSIINKVSFNRELSRVLVHGVLHLAGYDDHTIKEKKIMRYKEDYYLDLLINYVPREIL